MGKARKAFISLLVGAVKLYQLVVSPWLGARCRYVPGCSDYMVQAIIQFGPVRGVVLGSRRVFRCHPWGGSGFDPLPARDGRGVDSESRCSGARGAQL